MVEQLNGLADAARAAGAEVTESTMKVTLMSDITTMVKIAPDLDPSVTALVEQITNLRDYAITRTVICDNDVKLATEDLSLIATLTKTLDAKKKEYTGPVKDILRAMGDVFDRVSSPLAEANTITRKKIGDYRAEIERRRREAEEINRQKEELARKEAAFNQGEITVDTTPVNVPAPPPAHVRTEVGSLGTQKVWKFEVIDPAQLPREYLTPDLVKIGKVIRAGVSIPGVKAWQEESLRINSR
jgi:hypothetical protein